MYCKRVKTVSDQGMKHRIITHQAEEIKSIKVKWKRLAKKHGRVEDDKKIKT